MGADMRAILISGLVAAGLAAALLAQSFEAASIRVTRQSSIGQGVVYTQPGRLVAEEATVRDLVAVAYGRPRDQIVGGPDWMSSTRYAITATTTGDVAREEAQAMLRQLLANRFALASHLEQRELPVYALTLARRDGQLGSKLRRSGAGCAPMTPFGLDGAPSPPPPPPPPPGVETMRFLGERQTRLRCPTMFFPGGVSARAITFDEFVYRLSRFAGRLIVDRTALSGEFDVDLVYQPELAVGGAGAAATLPSLFSAVQDQLGLKLESTRAPVDVLVIDRLEPPTEN